MAGSLKKFTDQYLGRRYGKTAAQRSLDEYTSLGKHQSRGGSILREALSTPLTDAQVDHMVDAVRYDCMKHPGREQRDDECIGRYGRPHKNWLIEEDK